MSVRRCERNDFAVGMRARGELTPHPGCRALVVNAPSSTRLSVRVLQIHGRLERSPL